MCVTANQAQEGEVLDEKAMRAAEIHEVLSGLEDFKSRIVEDATRLAKKVRGKFGARRVHAVGSLTRCLRSTEETTGVRSRRTS